jgi:hypothetical protein
MTPIDTKRRGRGRPRIYSTNVRAADGLPRSFYVALSRYAYHIGGSVYSLMRAAVAYYINHVLRDRYPDVPVNEFDAELIAIRTLLLEEYDEAQKDVRVSEMQPGV